MKKYYLLGTIIVLLILVFSSANAYTENCFPGQCKTGLGRCGFLNERGFCVSYLKSFSDHNQNQSSPPLPASGNQNQSQSLSNSPCVVSNLKDQESPLSANNNLGIEDFMGISAKTISNPKPVEAGNSLWSRFFEGRLPASLLGLFFSTR